MGVTRLFFEIEVLIGKIKGALNRLNCCYFNQ